MLSIQKILVPVVFADDFPAHRAPSCVASAPLSCGGNPAARSNASQLSRRDAGERARDHSTGFARAHRPEGSERPGSSAGAGARWHRGHTCATEGRPGLRNREDGSRPERRPDRDVDPWRRGVLPPSAGVGDSEGTARNRLPGLDRRSPRRARRGASFRSAAFSVRWI